MGNSAPACRKEPEVLSWYLLGGNLNGKVSSCQWIFCSLEARRWHFPPLPPALPLTAGGTSETPVSLGIAFSVPWICLVPQGGSGNGSAITMATWSVHSAPNPCWEQKWSCSTRRNQNHALPGLGRDPGGCWGSAGRGCPGLCCGICAGSNKAVVT